MSTICSVILSGYEQDYCKSNHPFILKLGLIYTSLFAKTAATTKRKNKRRWQMYNKFTKYTNSRS